MHFSQLRSALRTNMPSEPSNASVAVLELRLQGFIDGKVLAERFEDLAASLEHEPPLGVLCDLREVAGYGPRTPQLARSWLAVAQRIGVRRVAVVATSSVVRTATGVLASGLGLELRGFLGDRKARRWLAGEAL